MVRRVGVNLCVAWNLFRPAFRQAGWVRTSMRGQRDPFGRLRMQLLESEVTETLASWREPVAPVERSGNRREKPLA